MGNARLGRRSDRASTNRYATETEFDAGAVYRIPGELSHADHAILSSHLSRADRSGRLRSSDRGPNSWEEGPRLATFDGLFSIGKFVPQDSTQRGFNGGE